MKPQINLRLPEDLKKAAEKYAKMHRYKNLQELTTEAVREKIMEKDYDEDFTPKQIELIDKLIEASILKRKLHTEKELMKALE
jgi:Arc/MetJ-type ribon-helix-helix transcriptional regulator